MATAVSDFLDPDKPENPVSEEAFWELFGQAQGNARKALCLLQAMLALASKIEPPSVRRSFGVSTGTPFIVQMQASLLNQIRTWDGGDQFANVDDILDPDQVRAAVVELQRLTLKLTAAQAIEMRHNARAESLVGNVNSHIDPKALFERPNVSLESSGARQERMQLEKALRKARKH